MGHDVVVDPGQVRWLAAQRASELLASPAADPDRVVDQVFQRLLTELPLGLGTPPPAPRPPPGPTMLVVIWGWTVPLFLWFQVHPLAGALAGAVWLVCAIVLAAFSVGLQRQRAHRAHLERVRAQLRADVAAGVGPAVAQEKARRAAAQRAVWTEQVGHRWQPQGPPAPPKPHMTWQGAERWAADHLRHLGVVDAHATQATRDGGIDVDSATVVAQVKLQESPVGPDKVQQLVGVAAAARKRPVFYSSGGYSRAAIAWAEQAGVALFVFTPGGSVTGTTTAAHRALTSGLT